MEAKSKQTRVNPPHHSILFVSSGLSFPPCFALEHIQK